MKGGFRMQAVNKKAVSFFETLFKDSFTRQAKTGTMKTRTESPNTLGWSHVVYAKHKKPYKGVGMRTFNTFYQYIVDDEARYFTMNTFSSNHKRDRRRLRWLNGFNVDFDNDPELHSVEDVKKRCASVGLPDPTAINQTPRGWHVYWFFSSRVPATPTMKTLYMMINRRIVEKLNADKNHVGAERIIRIPHELDYFNDSCTSHFKWFIRWMHVNYPDTDTKSEQYKKRKALKSKVITVSRGNFTFRQPAMRMLLKGIKQSEKGGLGRNTACYCLAKVYRHEGFSQTETLLALSDWNERNYEAMEHDELKTTIASAYRDSLPVPSKKIRFLTGLDFYLTRGWYKHKKERAERARDKNGRIHYDEWLSDLITYLTENDKQIQGSQKALAESLNIPLSSFKELLKLIREGQIGADIHITVEGRGCHSKTTIRLLNANTIKYSHSKRKVQDKSKQAVVLPSIADGITAKGVFCSMRAGP